MLNRPRVGPSPGSDACRQDAPTRRSAAIRSGPQRRAHRPGRRGRISATSLTIDIDPQTEARLRRQAEAAGTDLTGYVARLVREAAGRPSLDETLAPLRREFAASGMSDAELTDLISTAQAGYRRDAADRRGTVAGRS